MDIRVRSLLSLSILLSLRAFLPCEERGREGRERRRMGEREGRWEREEGREEGRMREKEDGRKRRKMGERGREGGRKDEREGYVS